MIENTEPTPDLPALPSWLEELLPEPTEPQVLHIDEATKKLALSYAGKTRIFDTLKEAHNASEENGKDLKIAREVYDAFSERGRGMLSYPSPDGKYFTMLMDRTDDDRKRGLQEHYQDFLKIAKAYKENPEDFYLAWHFVDNHPAFWWARDLETHPWFWEQSRHMSKVSQYVHREGSDYGTETEGNGPALVSLETGGHVQEDFNGKLNYKEHYGDWRLEVTAYTFEKAVVELARRVAICFHDDGSNNDDADEILEAQKPEWVKTLEDRLDEERKLND